MLEFLRRVRDTQRMYPNQRIGQTYFTVLSQISPTLAQEVLCTEGLDPFYVSMASPAGEAQIRRFLDFVRQRLPSIGNWPGKPADVEPTATRIDGDNTE